MSQEIACVLENYVRKLQRKEIESYSDIPEEYHNDVDVIRITRELGLREITMCGYDIITKLFFVEEIIMVSNYAHELIEREIVNTFSDFQAISVFRLSLRLKA